MGALLHTVEVYSMGGCCRAMPGECHGVCLASCGAWNNVHTFSNIIAKGVSPPVSLFIQALNRQAEHWVGAGGTF